MSIERIPLGLMKESAIETGRARLEAAGQRVIRFIGGHVGLGKRDLWILRYEVEGPQLAKPL